MVFSTRQRKALEILLKGGEGEITLAQVAARLGVSARTIHRELARVAPALEAEYGILLAGKAGQGMGVRGDEGRIGACLAELERGAARVPDAEERRRLLAALLLEGEGVVKLQALESATGLPEGAVRRDLEELRPWLQAASLSLSLRRGIGVVLEGGEAARRQAIVSLFMEEYGEGGVIDLVNEEGEDEGYPVRDVLLRLVPAGLFQAAEGLLSALPRESRPALAPRDYLALAVLVAVGVERRRRGFALPAPAGSGSAGPSPSAAGADDAAGLVEAAAADMAGLEPEEAEAALLRSVLRGAKPERPGDVLLGEMEPADLRGLRALVEACGRLLCAPFIDDSVLRDGLAAHWGPALHRLRFGLPIRNPLLPQIRDEYPVLFLAIRKAASEVFPDLDLPDDEIGYLVLHFGSSLGRGDRRARRFRALVVCSAGIGSAQMLASRIHQELPEIEVVASLSWFESSRVARGEWDILVSTIPLPLPASEYLVVSPLLPPEAVSALKAFMARRRAGLGKPATPPQDRPSPGGLTDLRAMSDQLEAAIGILERFRVLGAEPAPCPAPDWAGFLAALVGQLEGEGLVKNAGLALRDLELRSRDGGMILPGGSILFLHARTEGVGLPTLTLHALAAAPRGSPRAAEQPPARAVVMLAPPGLPRAGMDILNEISNSFLDEGTLAVLASGDETEIRDHYSRHLDRFARAAQGQGA